MEQTRRADQILINTKTLDTAPPASLHLLPCKIHYTGPAAVDSYFVIEQEEGTKRISTSEEIDESVVLKASLRGRLLRGRQLKLPPSYEGTGTFQWFFYSRVLNSFKAWCFRRLKPARMWRNGRLRLRLTTSLIGITTCSLQLLIHPSSGFDGQT